MENSLCINKSECCGCFACANTCPVGAIKMIEDTEGFLYPNIDYNKCIKCGLCTKVCLYKNAREVKYGYFENVVAYAGKHKDMRSRIDSQSGGAFSALSEEILLLGGSIYGATLDDEFVAVHKRADKYTGRDSFRGSKYIQSRIENTYLQCRNDLDEGKYVMFTGTPCQVEGLKRFIGKHKNIDKLYLVDIICHGVNSPMIWKKYIDFVRKKERKKEIISVNFRYKFIGWGSHFEKIEFSDGSRYVNEVFAKLFCSHLILRPSCYSCKFASLNRVSDVTIGDCWGIKEKNPKFYDVDGVSLIIVNTSKGKELVTKAQRNLQLLSCKIEDYMQSPLSRPVKRPEDRDIFWYDLCNENFETVLKKYGRWSWRRNFKGWLLKHNGIIRIIRILKAW